MSNLHTFLDAAGVEEVSALSENLQSSPKAIGEVTNPLMMQSSAVQTQPLWSTC